MEGIKFAVHTYGHFDAMFYVLNGIKMIMDSEFTNAMIKLMTLIATSYYALKAMTESTQGQVGHYLLKTMGTLLVITALITPKADMLVVDRIGGKREIISGLPYAFVLPVGALEAIGAGITSLFEQAFAPVSSTPYKDYGLIFGQRLVQEARNWRINNPEFASNMNGFIKRCVVLESMIGARFTPDDIFSSQDIFALVTDNAGTFRQVDFRIGKQTQRLNCKEAGKILKTYLKPEIDFLNFKYKASDFGIAGGTGMLGNILGKGPNNLNTQASTNTNTLINTLLNKNIEVGYASALGVNSSAADIIRQNMMINAIKDWGNISDKYGYTRADDLQKSNWKISGELAKEYLPILLNIMKGLIYASFIFIVPLMILSGGIRHYLKYCTVVFSLQIWPALNAVLNLFIELYSNVRGSAITNGFLTFANFNSAHEAMDTIVLVASGLQMSIPFLSFAIVQGGVSSFINLASQIQGASASAAGTASSELTSGNRSFDNINQNNQSLGNKSGYKTDFNQLYQEGASQIQGADGAILKNFTDGSASLTSGGGINQSSGATHFSLSQGEQTAAHENISSLLSSAKSDDQNYTNSIASQTRSAANLVASIAQRESAGESFDYKSLGEKGQNLQQMVNATKALNDGKEKSYQTGASKAITAYMDAGGKIPDFIPYVKAEAGVRAEGKVDTNDTSRNSQGTENSIRKGNDTASSFTNQEAVSHNKQWMRDHNIDSSFAEEFQGSYEKAQTFQQSASQKREEAQAWSHAAEYSRNNIATRDCEMYHEVEQGVITRYGVSQEAAHKMIENNDKRADKVWQDLSQSHIAEIKNQIQSGKIKVENNAKENANDFHNEHSNKVNIGGISEVRNQAQTIGLDKEKIKPNVGNINEELKQKFEEVTKENSARYNLITHENEEKEKVLSNFGFKDEMVKANKDDNLTSNKKKQTLIEKNSHMRGLNKYFK